MFQNNILRILIIDDCPDIQGLLRTLLESKGYEVSSSSNGAEALSQLNLHSVLPDLILVDLRMPVMDGFDFLTSQRANPRLRDIPTVVMSADGDARSTRLLTQAPNHGKSPDVLMKPLSIKSILTAIEGNSLLH